MRRLFWWVAMALFLLLGGCGYSEQKRENALEATLSQYRTAMRWGHWQTLISLRAPKAPAVPELNLDNIRVTGYEILQPPQPVDETQVLQVVEVEYVLQDSQRLRKLVERQDWRHDAEANKWLLHSPFPEFR